MFEGDKVQRVIAWMHLVVVDVAATEGLNGARVMADDLDELINILLGDVHGIFEDDPVHSRLVSEPE
jgi:hypothetical protein